MAENSVVEGASSKLAQLRALVRRVRASCARVYEGALPGAGTRRAMAGAALAVLFLFAGYAGSRLRTSLSLPVDILIGVVVAAAIFLLALWTLRLTRWVLGELPRWFGFVGAGALLGFLFLLLWRFLPPPLAFPIGIGLVVVQALLGGTIAALSASQFRQAGRGKKAATLAGLLLALGANAGLIYYLVQTGTDSHLVKASEKSDAPAPALLDAPDPSQRGPYEVRTLCYGSGTDRHRPEFGARADLKTKPVDAEPFVKGFEGWRKKLRGWYWGFGPDAFPLNGRVWYPDGPGPFPLVLVVHGNHHMADYSDPGYAYLGEHLASRGFILVSVDENFLNGSSVGGVPKENDARAWILLQHLKLWREWNGTEGNSFYKKVDLDDLGLIGHSRGGEAAGIAGAFNRMSRYPDDATEAFDFDFNLRAIIAIAPSDGQYRPASRLTPLENVNYLTVQGGHDADVSSFAGDRQYNRVRFTDGGDWFKTSVYIYRANHGQFNTVWGDDDWGPPLSWLLNRKPLLKGEEQRQVARVYFTAFLEATLRGDRRYRALFRDHRRIRAWLPDTLYITRYEDASFRLLTDYEEDVNVATTSVPGGSLSGENLAVWREQDIKFRGDWSPRENNGVYLGWLLEKSDEKEKGQNNGQPESRPPTNPPAYIITLPAGFARAADLRPDSRLVFQLSQADEQPPKDKKKDKEKKKDAKEKKAEKEKKKEEGKKEEKTEPVDLSIELVARNGIAVRLPLSQFRALPPVLKSRFSKLGVIEKRWYKSASEPVLQTFELPLAAFAAAERKFKPDALSAIRFVFDRSPKGVVILDRVGFARP